MSIPTATAYLARCSGTSAATPAGGRPWLGHRVAALPGLSRPVGPARPRSADPAGWRVYTSISRLRKLGLRDAFVIEPAGYRLAAEVVPRSPGPPDRATVGLR